MRRGCVQKEGGVTQWKAAEKQGKVRQRSPGLANMEATGVGTLGRVERRLGEEVEEPVNAENSLKLTCP